jgi:hypothetical protein
MSNVYRAQLGTLIVVLLVLISPLHKFFKPKEIRSLELILKFELKDMQYLCFILEFKIDLALDFENLLTSSLEQKQ